VRGLLFASIYDDNPVIFFEHRTLYGIKEEVPDELELIELGKARVHREGEDVTVVATGRLVHEALRAAEEAEGEGVSVEVVDVRSIAPLDKETILASVRKTGKAMVIYEDNRTYGAGAEVVATIQEESFFSLQAPIRRVASPDVPYPVQMLEEHYIPNAERVLQAILATTRD